MYIYVSTAKVRKSSILLKVWSLARGTSRKSDAIPRMCPRKTRTDAVGIECRQMSSYRIGSGLHVKSRSLKGRGLFARFLEIPRE